MNCILADQTFIDAQVGLLLSCSKIHKHVSGHVHVVMDSLAFTNAPYVLHISAW